ncbi:M24 family metallopeptidase [Candidatus Thorarchaeota archaeon]|nr:MAG: M24 family metallopeptidase [Candidatus Thorarchaeota archaeon]
MTVSQSGYFAEVARTIHLGKPSDQQKKMFKSVLKLAELIEKNMRPENQIDDVATNVIKKMGRRFDVESLIQPLGSSIGLDLREPPYLSQDSQFSLREGMVFTIHPTMCVQEAGCAKVADVVTITSDGYESLGSLSRETL